MSDEICPLCIRLGSRAYGTAGPDHALGCYRRTREVWPRPERTEQRRRASLEAIARDAEAAAEAETRWRYRAAWRALAWVARKAANSALFGDGGAKRERTRHAERRQTWLSRGGDA